jgi:3-hydroxy acid dehydrogenase / malonic semialdehyde reductase
MEKCVLITGATSGIGEATAKLLASKGYRLILTGRRQDRLDKIKKELTNIFNAEIHILPFDVRKREETDMALSSLKNPFDKIDILINNAGLAVGMNRIQEGITDDWERMIDTNIKGLLYVTRKIIPQMVQNNSGHIINISSIAGKEVYPFGNVYCASKHAVEAITKSLRLDLLQHNIKVSSVAPGAVHTEFSMIRFKGDKMLADQVYKGITPLTGEDIAEIILFIITRPPHVNIDDILVMPTDQAYSREFNRK